jgi:tRNA-Thr(GGU) m(6)t(6)A37 methyltransferase TsaA
MKVKPIGIIRSPFKMSAGTPIQSAVAGDSMGTVEVFEEFIPGLKDIEGFDRIWLLYWFDRAGSTRLTVIPYLDAKEHGVFATRAPVRPNPIGMSCVRLISVESNILTIMGIDILDETPLLDIKPYVQSFDSFDVRRCGWLDNIKSGPDRADERFEKR